MLLTIDNDRCFCYCGDIAECFCGAHVHNPKGFLGPRGFVLFWQTQNAQPEERRRVWDASYT